MQTAARFQRFVFQGNFPSAFIIDRRVAVRDPQRITADTASDGGQIPAVRPAQNVTDVKIIRRQPGMRSRISGTNPQELLADSEHMQRQT